MALSRGRHRLVQPSGGRFHDERAHDPAIGYRRIAHGLVPWLVESGLAEATEIITEKRQDLETLAKGLLEYETLTGEEIMGLLKGHPPVRDTCSDPEPPLRGSAVPTTGVVRPKPGPQPGGLEPQPQA